MNSRIPLFKVRMSEAATTAAARVLQSGYIGQGPEVDAFEQELAEWFNHPAPITTNSGTAALSLALRLIQDDAPAGKDEVLCPPLTCTATNWPVLAHGLRIRWVDTDPANCNMSMVDLRSKLSPRTLAIMLVHWGGFPCDLNAVRSIQDECAAQFGYRPPVIEDCAHAMGAEYDGKRLGNHGNYCMYSFQAIKHLTTIDGGALLCPTEEASNDARLLRWYGIDRTVSDNFRCGADVKAWGYKHHMNDVCAAVGRANLKGLDQAIAAHVENAEFYNQELRGASGVTLLDEPSLGKSAYWLFTILAERRDDLQRKLNERGIACGRVHERNDRHSCVAQFADRGLPGTNRVTEEMLCIPVGWWVSEDDRQYVVDSIREGW